MADVRIVNCHAHLFTRDHVPRAFPNPLVAWLGRVPGLLAAVAAVTRWLPWEEVHARVVRLQALNDTGAKPTQREVLRELLRFYPADARHVILPMDLSPAGYGPPAKDLAAQHDELAALALDPACGPRIVPFLTVHPGNPDAWAEARRCLDRRDAAGRRLFRGLKLYPKLGFAPTDDLLMREVFPVCEAEGLPVVSHCSRGGVKRKGWSQDRCDAVTSPEAWLPVLDAFPRLRVNLAHFGGGEDWEAYLDRGFDPDDPRERQDNWVALIADLIEREGRDNLWTDVSYTVFRVADYGALLRLLLQAPRLRRRVLFGSDFYLSRQERLSEKAMAIRLRDAVGEANWALLAETNPLVWLGERQEKEPLPPARPRARPPGPPGPAAGMDPGAPVA